MAAFAVAEKAKRRLIVELHELKLPIVGRDEDPDYGLAFDLLSSEFEKVFTGHENGVITLDLAEGDDVHREQLRVAMDEPYRTLLGHFRHEIGHYYYYRLVDPSQDYRQQFRELFGDPDADYQAALDRHYNEGAPPDWEKNYVSSYATMHPAEDWAETFAHYLHIRDTLDTAAAFSFAPACATFERGVLGPSGFRTIIDMWLPLAWALEHDQPLDGQRRPLPVRAARRRAGEDAVRPHRHRRGHLLVGVEIGYPRRGHQGDLAIELSTHEPATPEAKRITRLGFAVQSSCRPLHDLPSMVDEFEPEVIRSRPCDDEAVPAVDQQDRLAHCHRVHAVDGHHRPTQEMAATAVDQTLVGIGTHHGGHVLAASHRPAFDVVASVGGPQIRCGVGLTGVDQRTVRRDHPLDRALLLDAFEPSLQLENPLVVHPNSLPANGIP